MVDPVATDQAVLNLLAGGAEEGRREEQWSGGPTGRGERRARLDAGRGKGRRSRLLASLSGDSNSNTPVRLSASVFGRPVTFRHYTRRGWKDERNFKESTTNILEPMVEIVCAGFYSYSFLPSPSVRPPPLRADRSLYRFSSSARILELFPLSLIRLIQSQPPPPPGGSSRLGREGGERVHVCWWRVSSLVCRLQSTSGARVVVAWLIGRCSASFVPADSTDAVTHQPAP